MNKRHDAQIANWLRRKSAATAIAVVATAVFVAGLVRLVAVSRGDGPNGDETQAGGVPCVSANRADSPSQYVQTTQGARHVPGLSLAEATVETDPSAAVLGPARAVPIAAQSPAVQYVKGGTPSSVDTRVGTVPSASVPSVETGPELFGPSVIPPAANQGPAAAGPQPPPAVKADSPGLARTRADTAPSRSVAMEMIARQADEKVREGMELADRGALFAARATFIAALRLVAQGLDNDAGTTRHSQALSAALTAMKEAQDFLPAPGKVEGELDLPPIVAGHHTPLLKNAPPETLQAMRALKQYFNFAQDQLCQAVGHELSGSMALGALGKLHLAVGEKSSAEIALPDAKAITFFQAALLVYPRNYMAANDLGVLLAHRNDYGAARKALEHSVTVCRCAENLRNLSVVYRQLGESHLAEMAARDAEAVRKAEAARQRIASRSAGGAVQWVDASVFAKPAEQWTDMPVRPAATAAAQGATAANPAMTQPSAPLAAPALR